MTDVKKIILDYLASKTEPVFVRQMIIEDPESTSNWDRYFSHQKLSYYLRMLTNENKVERIATPGDSYRYLIKK